MTTMATIQACSVRVLRKLQENIEWAQMQLRPSESRSISIVMGKLSDQCFHTGDSSQKPGTLV